MLKSDYVSPYQSDPYACNNSNLADVYTFKILDLNLPTSDSHQCRNALKRFRKRYRNGEGFIIDGHRAWFAITAIYNTTTHIEYYCQVAFHKLASIKFFYKNPDDATISIVFNKFIAAICDYDYASRTAEALDEHTFLTLINYLINPVAYLLRNIKSCEIVENKGVGFTAQQVIDAVLDYAKVPVMIHPSVKSQYHTKATGTTSDPKDTRYAATAAN